MYKKIIVVGGPTATGKTKLAISAASIVNGEILNADSMQVYSSLNIGTNKGDLASAKNVREREVLLDQKKFVIKPYYLEGSKIVSWLFDLVPPDYNFTVIEYKQLAEHFIQDIRSRGKVPILVGGTGLYIDAVLRDYNTRGQVNRKLREELKYLSIPELHTRLLELDFKPDLLNNSDKNNPRRLIRLIERLKSENTPIYKSASFVYDHVFLYPRFEFKELEQKLKLRVDRMLAEGFIMEVEELLRKGYSSELKALQATGYREVIMFLQGKIISIEELKKKIVLAHRQYAKRQVTWFEGRGRNYDLVRINFDSKSDLENSLEI